MVIQTQPHLPALTQFLEAENYTFGMILPFIIIFLMENNMNYGQDIAPLVSLLCFFSMSAENQIGYLPSTMEEEHFDLPSGALMTNKPLEVLLVQLTYHCGRVIVWAGMPPYEHINDEKIEEVYQLGLVLLEYFSFVEQPRRPEVFEATDLVQPIWNIVRQICIQILKIHLWEIDKPIVGWRDLVNL